VKRTCGIRGDSGGHGRLHLYITSEFRISHLLFTSGHIRMMLVMLGHFQIKRIPGLRTRQRLWLEVILNGVAYW